jgi:hypothetical protein
MYPVKAARLLILGVLLTVLVTKEVCMYVIDNDLAKRFDD